MPGENPRIPREKEEAPSIMARRGQAMPMPPIIKSKRKGRKYRIKEVLLTMRNFKVFPDGSLKYNSHRTHPHPKELELQKL